MGYVQTLNSLVLGLFSNGEPGFWLDPSDLSTMYQDSAGTTPVTAVEQPVGRINDKSGRGCNFTQSTAGVRPVLSARVNKLTNTEAFNLWTAQGGVVIANQVANPVNDQITAGFLYENGTQAWHQLFVTNYTAYGTYSCFAKAGTRQYLSLMMSSGNTTTYAGAVFDLLGGTVTNTVGANGAVVNNAYMVPVPGKAGWFFCSVAATSATAVDYQAVAISNAASPTYGSYGHISYQSDGASGLYVWGADLRPTDQATGLIPTYQRVNTSTDYDTAGFPLYLSGNGTQWMQCAAQDYTGVNKMLVCAGVRKLSDATTGIAEMSGTAGLFSLLVVAGGYFFRSQGTTDVNVASTGSAAPVTNVVTLLGDISAPVITGRVNGVQKSTSASSQGTGNYGNQAVTLFARAGGGSGFLTGGIYQIVGRGSTVASNAAQIAATENWTDSKCRAY